MFDYQVLVDGCPGSHGLWIHPIVCLVFSGLAAVLRGASLLNVVCIFVIGCAVLRVISAFTAACIALVLPFRNSDVYTRTPSELCKWR